jgi:hypothetical protein
MRVLFLDPSSEATLVNHLKKLKKKRQQKNTSKWEKPKLGTFPNSARMQVGLLFSRVSYP